MSSIHRSPNAGARLALAASTTLAFATLTMLGIAAAPLDARAQWTPVPEIPARNVVSLSVRGDTILAGMDTTVFVSTDAGATWRASRQPVVGTPFMQTVRMRNGRLYAGTGGFGVFVSEDLGVHWTPFNEGLVGGFLDTQLDVADLEFRGDSVYAATFGAGVYVRGLVPPPGGGAATWHPFGAEFELNQAPNVEDLATDGTRVLAAAGGNGSVFHRDPGENDWTISWLDNVGLRPGVQARQILWNGHRWVVGHIRGVSSSVAGQEPWSLFDPGFGALQNVALAARGRAMFAAFDFIIPGVGQRVAIASSLDDGGSWQTLEVLPGAFVFRMGVARSTLYAARADGLWRRSADTVSASDDPGARPHSLALAVVGRQPATSGDALRLRFDLPSDADASIELYDVRGRRVADVIRGAWSAGPHVVSLDAHALHAGVYEARVLSAGQQAIARVVRL